MWQHSLTVLSRCTRKIDVWILCVTIAKTFDAIVVSKALCFGQLRFDSKIGVNLKKGFLKIERPGYAKHLDSQFSTSNYAIIFQLD